MTKRRSGLLLIPLAILLAAALLLAWLFFRTQAQLGEQRAAAEELQLEMEALQAAAAGPARGGPAENGWLSVNGTQLVNEAGEPVQLRGMSSHGLVWFPEYTNAGAIKTTRDYGANLFRVAMYADGNNGGYSESEIGMSYNKKTLLTAVENTLANDMYAIADWHLLEDENPLKEADKAEAFFDELAARYADEPGVLYEICNEPNGDTTWADITEYANRVIPIIRKHAPHAVILVGTPAYSTDLAAAMAAPLPYDNILYSYHFYSGVDAYSEIGELPFVDQLDTAREAGLPVFVTEWGVSESQKTGALATETAQQFADYLYNNHISWAG